MSRHTRQDIGQRDLRSYTLHLLEQGHFRVYFLGDFLHPFVIFLDALVQRLDFFEQRFQNIPQLCAQCSGQLPAHLLRAALWQSFTIRLHQPALRRGELDVGFADVRYFGTISPLISLPYPSSISGVYWSY